jgi:hypothetical protein
VPAHIPGVGTVPLSTGWRLVHLGAPLITNNNITRRARPINTLAAHGAASGSDQRRVQLQQEPRQNKLAAAPHLPHVNDRIDSLVNCRLHRRGRHYALVNPRECVSWGEQRRGSSGGSACHEPQQRAAGRREQQERVAPREPRGRCACEGVA